MAHPDPVRYLSSPHSLDSPQNTQSSGSYSNCHLSCISISRLSALRYPPSSTLFFGERILTLRNHNLERLLPLTSHTGALRAPCIDRTLTEAANALPLPAVHTAISTHLCARIARHPRQQRRRPRVLQSRQRKILPRSIGDSQRRCRCTRTHEFWSSSWCLGRGVARC